MSTHCVPGSIPSAGPIREDKVDVAQSVMSLASFPGPLPLPPLMFSLQTAWVKIWVPHFQLCDFEQVTLLLWASIALSVKWKQASTYFTGILQEINEFTYVKYLRQCLAKRAQCVYVCVCTRVCVFVPDLERLIGVSTIWNASSLFCGNLGIQTWQSFHKGGPLDPEVRPQPSESR